MLVNCLSIDLEYDIILWHSNATQWFVQKPIQHCLGCVSGHASNFLKIYCWHFRALLDSECMREAGERKRGRQYPMPDWNQDLSKNLRWASAHVLYPLNWWATGAPHHNASLMFAQYEVVCALEHDLQGSPYLSSFNILLIQTNLLVPAPEKLPHRMMLPPPCITLWMVLARLWVV